MADINVEEQRHQQSDSFDDEPPVYELPSYQPSPADPPPPYTISRGSVAPGGLPLYYQGPQVMYTASPNGQHGDPSVTLPPSNPEHNVPVRQTFHCHMLWACVATWFCFGLLGTAAFFVAFNYGGTQ